MNAILFMTASNVAVATGLAVLAWSAGRWLRRPALAHALWLLVLLKLVTPPMVPVTLWRSTAGTELTTHVPQAPLSPPARETPPRETCPPTPLPDPGADAAVMDAAVMDADVAEVDVLEADLALPDAGAPPPARFFEPGLNGVVSNASLTTIVAAIWLAGSLLWLVVALRRLFAFHQMLHQAAPAPAEIHVLAAELANRLGVRCPPVVVIPGAITPLVWCWWGRPRLVVPATLVQRLDLEQMRTLLAHELAHVRRRDHWVRWLEFAVLSVYWWCPLAWWARQQLQQAEEECCDAWVVWALPEAARSYAAALVDTVDFLSGARPVLPVAASGLGHLHLLKRRLTMILRGTTPRALSGGGMAVVLILGAALLPLMPTWAQEPPRPPEPPAPPELPAQVQPSGDVDDPKPRPIPAQRQPKTQPPEEGDTRAEVERELRAVQREMAALQDQIAKKQRRIAELSQRLGQAPRDAALQYPPPRAMNPMTQPRYVVPQLPMAVAPPQLDRRPDLERRIDNLERKLDAVLNQLQGRQPSATPAPRPPVPRTPLAPLPPTQPRSAPGSEAPRPGADNLPVLPPTPVAAPSTTPLRGR
jgi:beta-lactamase regulating signal transducer with metallopeptidase domain